MSTANIAVGEWTVSTIGKGTRIAIACLGLISATLTLMLAPLASGASWLLVLAGVGLAATSVRAARHLSLLRLTTVAANLILILPLTQLG